MKSLSINKIYFESAAKLVYDNVIMSSENNKGLILCRKYNYFDIADILEEFFQTQTTFKEKDDGIANEITFSGKYGSMTIAQFSDIYVDSKSYEFYKIIVII